MYTSWLSPSSVSPDSLALPALGTFLRPQASPHTQIGLIGAHAPTADAVRRHLYAFSWDHGPLEVADLGNLRKRTTEFTIPFLRELHAAGILPVLFGGAGEATARAQYLAFGSLHRQIGIFQLDQHIPLSPDPGSDKLLDAAVHRPEPPRYHLAHAGSQRHLIDSRLDELFYQRNFERYSLGESRANAPDLEPCIRDADLALVDIGSVLHAEAPAQAGYHPSGLSLQQAGQLCYYAGNSDRMSSFGLYGLEVSEELTPAGELTAAACAQLLWYFLHGVSQRAGDFPVATTGMVEYIVDAKLPQRLTFWRSSRSNRWWIEVPTDDPRGEERNRLVACSYQDYLQASQEGRLPERIVRAFSRY
ncbi:hypothetical protein [Neolewinella sp.]|uniref:hypothetical protein n=1 Tax=Neolewinella sp. TaxID=2993543 RepID=UPI003B520A7A